jgi:hypothetical protein
MAKNNILPKSRPGGLKEEFYFKYLHQQFPWLSEGEIREAIKLKGSNADNVIKFLNDKGSKTKTVDQFY